jgi:hypothetical protein
MITIGELWRHGKKEILTKKIFYFFLKFHNMFQNRPEFLLERTTADTLGGFGADRTNVLGEA